jgi:hypothetical protein
MSNLLYYLMSPPCLKSPFNQCRATIRYHLDHFIAANPIPNEENLLYPIKPSKDLAHQETNKAYIHILTEPKDYHNAATKFLSL